MYLKDPAVGESKPTVNWFGLVWTMSAQTTMPPLSETSTMGLYPRL